MSNPQLRHALQLLPPISYTLNGVHANEMHQQVTANCLSMHPRQWNMHIHHHMCVAHSLRTSCHILVVLLTVTIAPCGVWLAIVHGDDDLFYNTVQHIRMIIDGALMMVLDVHLNAKSIILICLQFEQVEVLYEVQLSHHVP